MPAALVTAPLALAQTASAGGPFDHVAFCSNLLAFQEATQLKLFTGKLHRQCVMVVVNTYLIDGLQNKDADAVLLTDDAYRKTFGQNNQTDAEGFLRIQGLPSRVLGRVRPRRY